MPGESNPDLRPVGFLDVDSTASDKILCCLETLATMESVRVIDRRVDAYRLPTLSFAESDILFESDVTARRVEADLPEALTWLESYREGEAYAGVLMRICRGRKA